MCTPVGSESRMRRGEKTGNIGSFEEDFEREREGVGVLISHARQSLDSGWLIGASGYTHSESEMEVVCLSYPCFNVESMAWVT